MFSTVMRSITGCLFGILVLTLFPTRAFAQPPDVTMTQNFPMPPFLTDPCNGDVIAFTGGHTLQLTRTSTSNGFKLLSKLTSVGLGTAAVSQNQYHMNDTNNFEVNVNGSVIGQLETTQSVNLKVIGPGRTDDFFTGFLLHLTIDGAGVPSAVVDNPTLRCQ